MVNLLFGIHCHQPVDNFNNVVNSAIDKAYKPFIKTALKYDSFKFSVHYSGWLLEYIKIHDKELFNLLKKGADKGSIEFFTGGYYEPVLASITSDYRKMQVEKLSRFIYDNFGQKPKGLWLTERVWDDSAVKDMSDIGIKYVMADDYHFLSIGAEEKDLKGYYLTESEGGRLGIFPIDKHLRYSIPFNKTDDVLNYIESVSQQGKAAVIFDDGEKFGMWPGTHKWVYTDGWLDRFLGVLSDNEKIKSVNFRSFFEAGKPLGLMYLPTTSYYEMGEWSLSNRGFKEIELFREKAEKAGLLLYFDKYVKGGIWKNFFHKYSESNRIHKRVLELSNNKALNKDKKYADWIMKAQCNDVLWHGIFGGLYLPNLRDNAYRYIINAEKRRDELLKENIYCEIKDIDFDGYNEVKYSNEDFILIFDAKTGGQITELSLKDGSFNLQNTLTRRAESYHEKIMSGQPKSGGSGISTIHKMSLNASQEIKSMIKYDWYDKNSFIDHITDENISRDSFENCSFREYGDFANMPYMIKEANDNIIRMKRAGGIYKDKKYRASIEKTFKINNGEIAFCIDIETENKSALIYMLELNLHFPNLKKLFLNDMPIDKMNNLHKIRYAYILDEILRKKISIESDSDFDLLTYTANTVSQSEHGVDLTGQGQSLGFLFQLRKKLKIYGTLVVEAI